MLRIEKKEKRLTTMCKLHVVCHMFCNQDKTNKDMTMQTQNLRHYPTSFALTVSINTDET